ncbi:hypothetical protein GCM10017673_03730 [Streptosporangium violaceochromogenes]|nr:hypothetical protein GCM10017673_03730 [Streptosporangium violaceochromogenes]
MTAPGLLGVASSPVSRPVAYSGAPDAPGHRRGRTAAVAGKATPEVRVTTRPPGANSTPSAMECEVTRSSALRTSVRRWLRVSPAAPLPGYVAGAPGLPWRALCKNGVTR